MSDVKFTEDHEWIRIEGDVGTVGITNHAQEQLGDIVNGLLGDEPAKVNADAEGEGWFFKVKIADASQLDGLMDAEAYKAFAG